VTHPREDRLASEVAARLAGCPEADTLQQFRSDELDEATRNRVGEHLASCAACTEALAFLRSEHESDTGPKELPFAVEKRTETLIRETIAPADRATAYGWPSLLRVAAGVMLLAAVAVGSYHWLGPETGNELGALRGDEPLTLVAPEGLVASVPTQMEWIALPGSSDYRVTLLDDTLEEIWSQRVGNDATVLKLDESSLASLTPGGTYTWRVEALDEFGATVGSSPAAHFEIVEN
jgi:hypothetical protein